MSNVLITGTTGFVGSNLSPYLTQNGFSVLPISLRGIWKDKLPGSADAIIHLAGKAHDTKNASAPEEYFKVNTEYTKELFGIFLKSDIRDFIYFSSVKAVADTVTGILKEDHVPDAQTAYGQSKLQAEQYLLSQSLPASKRLFIIRPCMIHGPGNKGNLNLLYNFVKKGIPYPLAAYENKRSFLSIDNLLFVLLSILKHPNISGGVYNVSDDQSLSTVEVIEIIAEVNKKSPGLWKVSPSLINSIAKVGDVLRLPLNSERLKKMTENYVVSNDKIKEALRIQTLPVSSKDGLIKTIEYFKQQ